ncbi:MAG: hypothetical protein ACKVLA_18820 [Rhodobacterales bacterium]
MTDPAASTVRSRIRTVWDRAQLLIAFHRDPARKLRPEPFLWPPKDATAGLRSDADDQEAFVHLRGRDRSDDVQIKLRSDRIIARRDPGKGWSGVEIDDCMVRVLVGDVWIEVGPEGTVTRRADDSTTYLEGDGSIIKFSEDAEIMVSSDGSSITRRTADRIEGLTPDGVVSRGRRLE